jgi:hypothetical protein
MPFRAFLMMYFDLESRYSYDYGLWSALATYCQCYFGFIQCYLLYIYEKLCKFCILVWIHMDAHEYGFFFQNLNILCIFSDWFFDPVFFRFQLFGSTGSMTGLVLVALIQIFQWYLSLLHIVQMHLQKCHTKRREFSAHNYGSKAILSKPPLTTIARRTLFFLQS